MAIIFTGHFPVAAGLIKIKPSVVDANTIQTEDGIVLMTEDGTPLLLDTPAES